MNFKELLLVVGLALVSTWGIEYLFFRKGTESSTDIKSGQSFVAPKKAQKPINTEISFNDAKRVGQPVLTEIETDHANFVFSTDGASLERLEFKRTMNGFPQEMTTIYPLSDTEREERSFLVGFDDASPYYYTLLSRNDNDHSVDLVYEADMPDYVVRKTFKVYKNIYKITLNLNIIPKTTLQAPLVPRIFYESPIMPEVSDDIKSGIVSDEKGSITIINRAKIDEDRYWYAPTLFGTDNRYFVHALVDAGVSADGTSTFVQRGYFKLTGQNNIVAIVEGPELETENSWSLSFYFGPKQERAMAQVDPRLKQTLGHAGWLAPISSALLMLLNFLYKYLCNYGLAIIALTILTKLVLLPFSIKSNQSMKKHSEMQRKLKYLQQRYKDQPEVLAQERAELMRKEGLSSMAGCLPLLLQLPIFFALSRVLSTSIELYQAPFFGWITDLSARDPYYILPILVVLTMLAQAMTVDPKQRVQLIVMALVFGAITANLAAGLCLYIFMSTLLGVIQTVVQQKLRMA